MAQAAERMQGVLADPSRGRAFVADSLQAMRQAPGGVATATVPVERFLKELDTFLDAQQRGQAAGGDRRGGWKPLEVQRELGGARCNRGRRAATTSRFRRG